MGDASVVSQGNEPMPQDPNMNTDQGMQDPMAQGGDPSMMGDADPSMDMGGDPGMEDPMMGGNNMGQGEGNPDRQRKEIQKNIGKACADFRNYQGQDKEDLSKWVEGMLDSILDDSNAGIGDESEPDMDMSEEPAPQMESVIFTKKQLDKLNEEFGIENLSSKKEDETKIEKKQNTKNNNTPFSNPKLNLK